MYSFERREHLEHELLCGDDTRFVFVNLQGDIAEEPAELQAFVNYMKSGEKQTAYTRSLDKEVIRVRNDEKWRREMRTLEDLKDQCRRYGIEEGRAEGRAEGIAEGEEQTLRRVDEVFKRLLAEGREAEVVRVTKNLDEYCKEFGIA